MTASISHNGGPCPVSPEVAVRPVYRGQQDPSKGIRITIAPAGRLDWSHDGGPDDIVGYSVAHEFSNRAAVA